ncbi:hypothetical protein BEH_07790 [Priestia filamentosa]|uniref:Uncharacterized protein n=1 Tax=Priestia filamentosa TaxID=1402861 RepID=A0A0H4KGS6_9BACI|nr:hypothetical protein [Priestia filamentosa]AKO92011.1 hypothetical protein BEH_07790 [Priestia filamentosa]
MVDFPSARIRFDEIRDKGTYIMFVNGKRYGSGDLVRIRELISNYILIHQIHNKEDVSFRIVRGEK